MATQHKADFLRLEKPEEPKVFSRDFLSSTQRKTLRDQITKVDDRVKEDLLDECSVIIQRCREYSGNALYERPSAEIRKGLDGLSTACSRMEQAMACIGAASYALIDGRLNDGERLYDMLRRLSADLHRLQTLSDQAKQDIGEDIGTARPADVQADYLVEQMLNAFWRVMGRYPSARGRDAWFVGLVQAAAEIASLRVGEEKIERLAKSRADYDFNGHLAVISHACSAADQFDCLSRTAEENFDFYKNIKCQG